ncbi:MAG: ATP-dependent DNA helicase RecG, partial [Proteobacteria bacterium]|nr:ATP-dependent DNA helicase RecG [Pseudomonadota bacterium]
LGVRTVLLTGSVKGKARKDALAAIADGSAQIVVGTHALFQEQVQFHSLALAVIDEQHRFGVKQRMALLQKGTFPHLLHMTATPIPRSLTMMLYGDMDCSTLREKPAERLPITTRVIPVSRYRDIMERLQAALDKGEKAYWICPLIDEAEVEGELQLTPEQDIAAAESRFTEFAARFGPRVGLVHGRMKAAEREVEMQRFQSGETRLLVATTVVEVGVDVRDATIIVIEKAERFGLAQLHQLRGRVGRGNKQSACVLLFSDTSGETAKSRLSILRDSEDGFAIAEADLQIRGGGDLLGSRQSGLPRFIFTDIMAHQEMLDHARADSAKLLESDPQLASPRGRALQVLLQLFS